jgi:hypothetical protein
MGMSNPVAP